MSTSCACHLTQDPKLDDLFAKAAARRARALASGPTTPLKSGAAASETPVRQMKRATKGTPTQVSTPTPTPGQKHMRVATSPPDTKLKVELTYPTTESVSTATPGGTCFYEYMYICGGISCGHVCACVCIRACMCITHMCPRWQGLDTLELRALLCGLIGVLGRCNH